MDRIELDKKGVLFSDVSWVASAVSKDLGRRSLTCLYVDTGWIVATDGHQLHAMKFEEDARPDWEEGLYRILSNKKTELVAMKDNDAGKFPDWRAVFPSDEHVDRVEFTLNAKNPDGPYAKTIRMLPAEFTLAYKYFVALGDGEYCALYYKNGPVCFIGGSRWALIMPKKVS